MRRTILVASLFSSVTLAAAFYPLSLVRNTPSSPALIDLNRETIYQQPMNPGPVQGSSPANDVPNEALPGSSNSNNGAPSDTTLSIADILPQTRKINIFASLTRDISSITSRLESTSSQDNTTVLAPLNSVMQSLPRKPWEDRPDDTSEIRAERDEDKAAHNLQRFVESHVVPMSPWKEGKDGKVKTVGGGEIWWEERDGRKVIMPGEVEVDGVVGRVGNGEVWAIKGVVNYV
jgi:hypothetical protein